MRRTIWGASLRNGLVAAVVVVCVAYVRASAQCEYEAAPIVPPHCPFNFAFAAGYAVNNQGLVAGQYAQCSGTLDEAFTWSAATGLVTLPRGDYAGAVARDVNDQGDVVGYVRGETIPLAALWRDGQLQVLGAPPGGNWSEAEAINRHGQVVGYWQDRFDVRPQGFIWDGEMVNLGDTIGAEFSGASDINDYGQVVGWRAPREVTNAHVRRNRRGRETAFVWKDGVVTDLGPIPGGTTSYAFAINNRGEVVGYGTRVVDGTQERRGFYWSNGTMVELPPLPGHLHTSARDINDAGVIIGRSWVVSSLSDTVLWLGGVPHRLEDLLVEGSGAFVNAISGAGQMAGGLSGGDEGALFSPTSPLTGDIDCDHDVDVNDLAFLLGVWGACNLCPADLDRDGLVGPLDLFLVLSNWGSS